MFTLVSYLPLQILQKQKKFTRKTIWSLGKGFFFCSLFGQNYDNNDNDGDDNDNNNND